MVDFIKHYRDHNMVFDIFVSLPSRHGKFLVRSIKLLTVCIHVRVGKNKKKKRFILLNNLGDNLIKVLHPRREKFNLRTIVFDSNFRVRVYLKVYLYHLESNKFPLC